MIYELRVYRAMPGKFKNLVARFGNDIVPAWTRLGIRPVGFWTTLAGGASLTQVTYMIAWESLEERQAKWAAFNADPEWLKAREASERDGPLVADLTNQFLTPTAYSALQ